MDDHQTDFDYSARRSREELIRAIGSDTEAAAYAHLRLSVLHSARTAQAMRAADGA